ncbi:TPA: hypothetical protein ACGW3M_001157 [Pseudomonas aeruginosa]|uniref:hypothetical protein n=1 Tax=Pseudomonas aeruginosa TaxID=287 RepID=UPI0027F7DB41|nr:hypothetical protein [Pseudomonas aeruginosa]ELJ2278559.1 hypothetical protein [Pseudomonas aeruginosa]
MPPITGIIVQVKGLGVPVQAPTDKVDAGYMLRWSSDPDLPPDLPTHVLSSEREAMRFLQLAVDGHRISPESVRVLPIQVERGQTAVTAEEAIGVGADPENWNMVRVALSIAGNSSIGPVVDNYDWTGTRQEFQEGQHLRDAMKRGQSLGMRNPSFFTHNEGAGHIINAANHIQNVRRQFNPSLRTAELIATSVQDAVLELDVPSLSHERALFYLTQIKSAFASLQVERLHEAQTLGRAEAEDARVAQDQIDHLSEHEQNYEATPEPPRKPSGPRLH